jgi:hypothetical protein
MSCIQIYAGFYAWLLREGDSFPNQYGTYMHGSCMATLGSRYAYKPFYAHNYDSDNV